MALAAYRHVLRGIRVAFQGDAPMTAAAHQKARQDFEQGRSLATGSKEAAQGIEHAETVAILLRQNVVQGTADAAQPDRFKLRIHEETERGDNDSVKMGEGAGALLSGAKCERLR